MMNFVSDNQGKTKASIKGRFKPGSSGNPTGRPTVPKAIRDMKKLNALELEQLVSTLFYANAQKVTEILADDNAPMIERIVAQILLGTLTTGHMVTFDQLLNRVIGKVRETIKHEGVAPTMTVIYPDGLREEFSSKVVKGDE